MLPRRVECGVKRTKHLFILKKKIILSSAQSSSQEDEVCMELEKTVTRFPTSCLRVNRAPVVSWFRVSLLYKSINICFFSIFFIFSFTYVGCSRPGKKMVVLVSKNTRQCCSVCAGEAASLCQFVPLSLPVRWTFAGLC